VSDHQHEKTGASVAKSLAPLFIGWALLLGAVTLGFNVFLEHRENPNQLRLASAGNDASSLVLQQNFAGHYLVNGEINGRGVEFMLDTGATLVAAFEIDTWRDLQPGTGHVQHFVIPRELTGSP